MNAIKHSPSGSLRPGTILNISPLGTKLLVLTVPNGTVSVFIVHVLQVKTQDTEKVPTHLPGASQAGVGGELTLHLLAPNPCV